MIIYSWVIILFSFYSRINAEVEVGQIAPKFEGHYSIDPERKSDTVISSIHFVSRIDVTTRQIPVMDRVCYKSWQDYLQTIHHEPHKQELIKQDLQRFHQFVDDLGINPLSISVKDQLQLLNLPKFLEDRFPHISGFYFLYEKEIFILNKYQEILFPKNEFRAITEPAQIQQIAYIYAQYLRSINPFGCLEILKELAGNNDYFKVVYDELQRSNNSLGSIIRTFKNIVIEIKDIWHENYNCLKTVPSNEYNEDIARLISYLNDNDFKSAKRIHDKYYTRAESSIHLKNWGEFVERYARVKNIYQQAYDDVFNEYGINKYLAALDPYYHILEDAFQQGKIECKQHSPTSEQLNAQLLQRYNEAKQLISLGKDNQENIRNIQIAYSIIDNQDNP